MVLSLPLALGAMLSQTAKVDSTSTNTEKCSSSTIYIRYQHYGRELALFLLQHGQEQLQFYLKFLFSASSCIQAWIDQQWSIVQKHEIAVYISAALAYARAWVNKVSKPLGQLLSQLISLQLRITTNDHLDDISTKMSARLNTCLTLLYGAIRLRSHSYLQVCMPSRQPHLQPEFSLVSPSVSPQPGGSPHKHSSRAQQQQALMLQPSSNQQQLQLPGPPRSPRTPRGQQGPPGSVQQSGAADSEVHLLCSSELKSAIISFLQHHSTTSGQEFVLLRSTSWGAGLGPAAAAGTEVQQQQQQQYSSGGSLAAPASSPAVCQSSGKVVSPGASSRIRQSRQLFQALAENNSSSGSGGGVDAARGLISPRLTQSLSALTTPQAECCSSNSPAGDEGFAFAAGRAAKPHQVAAAARSSTPAWGGASSSNSMAAAVTAAVQRCSWPGPLVGGDVGMFHLMQVQEPSGVSSVGLNDAFAAAAAAADGVVAVSIDDPLNGTASPRFVKQQQLQRQPLVSARAAVAGGDAGGGGFVPPTADCLQLDPCLLPLKSFSGNSRSFGPRSSIGSGSCSGGGEHAAACDAQQQAGQQGAGHSRSCLDCHQQQQQQQQQQRPGSSVQAAAAGSLPGSHRVCDGGGRGYTPPRSVSPIGVPARHGVRKAAKKLPAAPFTLSAHSPPGQQQQQQ